jgi:hypothetical protein
MFVNFTLFSCLKNVVPCPQFGFTLHSPAKEMQFSLPQFIRRVSLIAYWHTIFSSGRDMRSKIIYATWKLWEFLRHSNVICLQLVRNYLHIINYMKTTLLIVQIAAFVLWAYLSFRLRCCVGLVLCPEISNVPPWHFYPQRC